MVTVAVLDEPKNVQVLLKPQDIERTVTKGTGPGGQHRNTTESCVVLKHIPTGVSVRIDSERSQHKNEAIAMSILWLRVQER